MGYFFIGGMILCGSLMIAASLDSVAKAIRNINVNVNMGKVEVRVEE